MITEVSGNIFESGADILVNAVNCVGVMGGGIALEFKTKYPEYFTDYYYWCEHHFFEAGIVKPYLDESGLWIVSAATKNHWREDSKYGFVESIIEGLYQCFDSSLIKTKEKTIALPALGCGLGGLKYSVVREIIMDTGKRLPYKEILLYKPL